MKVSQPNGHDFIRSSRNGSPRFTRARTFISSFVDWYNSGIDFHTPANVHYGHAADVARERSATHSPAERVEILSTLNAPEFVDLAPMQVYTKLLDRGIYLGSLSTFYRVLEGNQQIKEHRRLATHPPRRFRN